VIKKLESLMRLGQVTREQIGFSSH